MTCPGGVLLVISARGWNIPQHIPAGHVIIDLLPAKHQLPWEPG